MSTPEHLHPRGAGTTPITPDEAAQLKLDWVSDREGLNRAEARTIARVEFSLVDRPPALDKILDDLWLRRLHERMLGEIWRWAGSYRTTERNIGISSSQIAVAVRNLVRDSRVWFEHQAPTDAAGRFHHRLVQIHPFADGNGRHSRIATDACLRAVGRPPFTWGSRLIDLTLQQRRDQYYEALRIADRNHDWDPLVRYAQS